MQSDVIGRSPTDAITLDNATTGAALKPLPGKTLPKNSAQKNSAQKTLPESGINSRTSQAGINKSVPNKAFNKLDRSLIVSQAPSLSTIYSLITKQLTYVFLRPYYPLLPNLFREVITSIVLHFSLGCQQKTSVISRSQKYCF